MKNILGRIPLQILTLAVVLAALAACGTTQITTSTVRDPVLIVIGRHDRYVQNDGNLSDQNKQMLLGESATIKSVVQAAGPTMQSTVLSGPFTVIADRHDAYVAADVNLSPIEKRTYLRSTELIRLVVRDSQGAAVTP